MMTTTMMTTTMDVTTTGDRDGGAITSAIEIERGGDKNITIKHSSIDDGDDGGDGSGGGLRLI